MGGKFSRLTAKSHAGIYFRSVIERLIMLLRSVLRARRNAIKAVTPPAAIKRNAPIAIDLLLVKPEFSGGNATIFVLPTTFVRAAEFVGGVGTVFVTFTDATTAGAGDGVFVGGGGRRIPTFVPTIMMEGTTTADAGGGTFVGCSIAGA